jgi:DNA-binding transcriptional ArsR family regulator
VRAAGVPDARFLRGALERSGASIRSQRIALESQLSQRPGRLGHPPGQMIRREIVDLGLDNIHLPIYIYISMHVSMLRILADPTRLHIVEMLRRSEHSVNDIVKNVDVDQSGVSRHLHILHEAGFVRVRPDGQKRFYSLCPGPFRNLDAWLGQYRQLWEGRLDKFGEALALKREAKESGPQTRKSSRREHHGRRIE